MSKLSDDEMWADINKMNMDLLYVCGQDSVEDCISYIKDLKEKLSKYELLENKIVIDINNMDDLRMALKGYVRYCKNPNGTFKLDDAGKKMEKEPLSPTTINQYINYTLRLHPKSVDKTIYKIKSIEDLSYLEDPETIKKVIIERAPAISSQSTYYTGIVSILSTLKLYPDALQQYRKFQEEVSKKYKEDNATGVISDKQAESFAEQEEYDAMVTKMESEIKLSKTPNLDDKLALQNLILVKLYQKYPVRNEIATIINITKEDFMKLDDKNKMNYLVKDGSKLYMSLNDYKTNKTFGENVLKITPDIKKLLTQWLKYYNTNEYVFMNMDGDALTKNNLSKVLVRITTKHMGKAISTRMIRKIYLSSKYADKNEEQAKDSKMMGHSIGTQNKVYIKTKQ